MGARFGTTQLIEAGVWSERLPQSVDLRPLRSARSAFHRSRLAPRAHASTSRSNVWRWRRRLVVLLGVRHGGPERPSTAPARRRPRTAGRNDERPSSSAAGGCAPAPAAEPPLAIGFGPRTELGGAAFLAVADAWRRCCGDADHALSSIDLDATRERSAFRSENRSKYLFTFTLTRSLTSPRSVHHSPRATTAASPRALDRCLRPDSCACAGHR